MSRLNCGWILFAALLGAMSAVRADTHYVNRANATPVPGYTGGWSSAATNIQDALDWAVSNDVVLVASGVYDYGGRANYPAGSALTNRVVISNAVTVMAVSANPADTLIVGKDHQNGTNGPAAVRCVYMNSSAYGRLIGFTITNGHTLAETTTSGDGGGIYCNADGLSGGYVSNCTIVGNVAWGENQYSGGGGGGVCRGNYFNCLITANRSDKFNGGGGSLGLYSNCTISYNSAINQGGGLNYPVLAYNCIISNNTAGGAAGGYSGTYLKCLISGNSATGQGGGIGGGFSVPGKMMDCIIEDNYCGGYGAGGAAVGGGWSFFNCVFRRNRAQATGGGCCFYGTPYLTNCLIVDNPGGAFYNNCYAFNCTIVSNGMGLYQGGVATNCIIYDNAGRNVRPGFTYNIGNSCVDTGTVACTIVGTGNITNNPLFFDFTNGIYKLQNVSPCVNQGMNDDWMNNSVDLGGLRRIIDGTVDMGAYEFLPRGTIITILGAQ